MFLIKSNIHEHKLDDFAKKIMVKVNIGCFNLKKKYLATIKKPSTKGQEAF